MAKEFNPSKPGALRAAHEARWSLEQDFAQPTLDMLESGRNLRQFEAEENPNYDYRKYNSTPLDMIPDALSLRQDNIFRVAPTREFEKSDHKELIETLIADADNEGTSLDNFMRRALWLRNALGVDIVTQMSAAPEGTTVVTQADVTEAKLRPVFLMFSALQKVDWASKGSGLYSWIRYALGEMPAPDEQSDPPGIAQFLSLTPETWTKWEQEIKSEDKSDPGKTTSTSGPHPEALGIVPVTKLYFQESAKAGEGGVSIALITRAAVLARYLLNLKSQADMDILGSVVRWVMTGVSDDKAPGKVGPMLVWATDNTEADLKAVTGGVAQITEKREWVKLIVTEILRLLKFRGGMGDTEGNQASGVKLALEMTDLRNELLATADQMEAAEVEMMRQAVIMATGQDVTDEQLGYTVQYNKDFVLDSATELLEQMDLWVNKLDTIAVNVPEIAQAMTKRLANQYIRQDSPVAKEVAESILSIAPTEETQADEPPQA